jgi:hypothetical protein
MKGKTFTTNPLSKYTPLFFLKTKNSLFWKRWPGSTGPLILNIFFEVKVDKGYKNKTHKYMEVIYMAVKTETLTIKVDEATKERVKQLAAEKDWTVSKWLYNELIKHLEIQEEDK